MGREISIDVECSETHIGFDPYFGMLPLDGSMLPDSALNSIVSLEHPFETAAKPIVHFGSGFVSVNQCDASFARIDMLSVDEGSYADYRLRMIRCRRDGFVADAFGISAALLEVLQSSDFVGCKTLRIPSVKPTTDSKTAMIKQIARHVIQARSSTPVLTYGINTWSDDVVHITANAPADLPDPAKLPNWRDQLVEAAINGASWDFTVTTCAPLTAACDFKPVTGLDPVGQACRQALAMVNTQSDVWMPSSIAMLVNYPDLAQKLTRTAIHAKSAVGLSAFGIGVLATSLLSPTGQTPFMSAFLAEDWQRSDWIAWGRDRSSLEKIMKLLSEDALVTDIDQTFGQGAALRLGQMIASKLRDCPAIRDRLTYATQVMGRA